MISARTKAALAAAKARGVVAGIARALTARGVPTPSGRGAWSPATVLRLERATPAREAA
jgi:hypothetical protein